MCTRTSKYSTINNAIEIEGDRFQSYRSLFCIELIDKRQTSNGENKNVESEQLRTTCLVCVCCVVLCCAELLEGHKSSEFWIKRQHLWVTEHIMVQRFKSRIGDRNENTKKIISHYFETSIYTTFNVYAFFSGSLTSTNWTENAIFLNWK